MDQLLERDLVYVISLDEILWGGLLLATTMALHGSGMLLTLRVSRAVQHRFERTQSLALGLSIVILASWMIILVNLVEITAWAGFYVWKGAIPNPSSAFYYALGNYTTLQSGYLPRRWRLLEGLMAMAGLLTFAWSTGVLFTLAQDFQEKALSVLNRQRESRESTPAPARSNPSGDSGRS
jgi:hypothetical protein